MGSPPGDGSHYTAAPAARFDGVTEFHEAACLRGGLGRFEAKYLMLLALAHAQRLGKYGA